MRAPTFSYLTIAAAVSVLGSIAAMASAEDTVQSHGLAPPALTVPSAPPPQSIPLPARQHRLTVRTVGNGFGQVSLPPTAACPPTCSAHYPQGAPVILAPVPAQGSSFSGWTGDCQDMRPCALRMNRPMTVKARFTKLPPTVTPAAPAAVPIPSPVVPFELNTELRVIATMIADGNPTGAIMDAWKNYVT
jgi:hypothetical protein